MNYDREHYHRLLDIAMDNTKEGDFFLSTLTDLILRELKDANSILREELKNKGEKE